MSKNIRYMLYNILVVLLFSCISKPDTTEVFKILNATINDSDEINLNTKITNQEDVATFFYKPDMTDICINILHFSVTDTSGVQHYYDICGNDSQIDEITLTKNNSIRLKKDESVQINFSLKLSLFTPKLSRESVSKIKCIIDYSDVNLIGFDEIYQKKIKSETKF